MIISRTPLRISFAGGGSDMAAFYLREAGAVVSTAISKFIYITVNKKFDDSIRASYSVTEIVDRVDDLRHELIRESLRLVGLDGGIEVTSISDIPSGGTGLGSSSAYTVGLLNAFHVYSNQCVGAELLAREACHIEIDICRKPIGKQDQYIAAYGGLKFLQFDGNGDVAVDPVICPRQTREQLHERLLLLFTGLTRSSTDILGEQVSNVSHDPQKRATLRAMTRLAHDFRRALETGDVDACGEILHEGWLAKRRLATGISNPRIDAWYDRARAEGALGGKVTGAGGGGFLLLFAPVERHEAILRALPELRPVTFSLEPHGSRIIYVEESV